MIQYESGVNSHKVVSTREEAFTVTTETKNEWLSPTEFWYLHNQQKMKFGRNLMFDWLAGGKLPHIRIGRKILIPADAFERMLEAQRES